MTTNRQEFQDTQAAVVGLLLARPTQPTTVAPRGLQSLELSDKRDTLLYVPPTYQVKQPVPLVVMLHGAGGDARGGLKLLMPFADAAGLILLAPASRQKTWDIIFNGQYGSDIALIDTALDQVFSRYAIDQNRLAIGGFSDGASHVIAFSPGFMAPARQQGKPRLFISRTVRDKVLPIDRCSRKLVPQLKRAGYDVLYREFDGSHTIPPEIAHNALSWFTETP